MEWRHINKHQSYQKIRTDLEGIVTPDNYGFGVRDWNLTEFIEEPTQMGTICCQIVAGENIQGKSKPMGGMKAPDGRGGFPFRLRVLTRQACDGTDARLFGDREEQRVALQEGAKFVNGWSAGNTCKRQQTPQNSIFPAHGEPPEQGDVIAVKHGPLTHDDGSTLTPQERDALMARGKLPYLYALKTVDGDGCIWCEYAEAHQLLAKNGKRLVFPEFRRPDRSLENAHREGRGPEPRVIAQWHFEEVPHDYHVSQPVMLNAAGERDTEEETEPDAEDSENN